MNIEGSAARKYHLEPVIQPDFMVSSISHWSDIRWELDTETAGTDTGQHTIRWDFKLDDGSRFNEPQYADLLSTMRRFTWSLFTDNRGRRNLKSNSLAGIGKGIRFLVRWMVNCGLLSIDQFDERAGELYMRDLIVTDEFLIDGGDDEDVTTTSTGQNDQISFSQAISRLRVLYWLHQQGTVLAECGIKVMPQHPFKGISMMEAANSIQRQQESTVLPLPSEVAVPILNAALRLLGTPAEDVIQLHELHNSLRLQAPIASSGYPDQRFIATGLADFRFSTVPGEKQPWHPPLRPPEKRTRNPVKHEVVVLVPKVSFAVRTIISAGIVVIQGLTGIRISELAGLMGTIDPLTGLPACITIRSSRTGLHDLFYLSGKLFKTTPSSRDAEWLCGLRPKGSTYLPPVVHAAMVIERLLRPIRELGGVSQLFVLFTGFGLPLRPDSVKVPESRSLLHLQRTFIEKQVEISWATLPDRKDCHSFRERGSEAFRSHQWRKTWAHFMFAVDQSSLPLITQHFKHLSLAMTEQGYLGNDPELLELLQQTRLAMTVQTFYEAINGERLIQGGMSQMLDAHRSSLAARSVNKPPEEGKAALEQYILRHDLPLWFQEHGKCAIAWRPLAAACHEASGTTSTRNRTPNWSTRTPSMCMSCPCWFTDREHIPYWLNR